MFENSKETKKKESIACRFEQQIRGMLVAVVVVSFPLFFFSFIPFFLKKLLSFFFLFFLTFFV